VPPGNVLGGATSGVARVELSDLRPGGRDLRSLLGRNEGFLTTVVENMPAVVFVKDSTTGRFILLNRAGEEFLGVSRAAIVGKTDHDFFPKEEADRFVARDRRALESRYVQVVEEEPVHTPHNGLRFLRTRTTAIRDEADRPQYILGISEDITEQKLAGERIRYMAHHDGLTNLANRALFRQHLDAAMADFRRTRRGVALFFFDLDGFKKINDTLGHPTGDALLRMLADRVRQCAGAGDTVARLGGDAFAILHPAVPMAKQEQALARELAQRIAKPFDVGGNRPTVTASIGISASAICRAGPGRRARHRDGRRGVVQGTEQAGKGVRAGNRHRRERRGPSHRRGCQGHCHGRQEDRQGRLVHHNAGLRLLGSQVRPAGQQRPQWPPAGSSLWPRGASSANIAPTSRTDPSMMAGMPIR
jgi:diguanylate cyclase (GGDEF)-like protein/PAS domain S-box-containing protein